jgi:hypothetical protein
VWNNTEEEFWFQTAFGVALALAIAARHAGRRATALLTVLVAVIVINNLLTFELPRRRFPYRETVDQIAHVAHPGDAVFVSGGDEPGLLYGVNRTTPVQVTPIDQMLERDGYQVDRAVRTVGARMDSVVAAGGRVLVLGVLEPNLRESPWSWLEEQYRIGPQPFIGMLRERGTWVAEPVTLVKIWRLVPRSTSPANSNTP